MKLPIAVGHNRELHLARIARPGVKEVAHAIVDLRVVSVPRAVIEPAKRLHVEPDAMPLADQRGGRDDLDLTGTVSPVSAAGFVRATWQAKRRNVSRYPIGKHCAQADCAGCIFCNRWSSDSGQGPGWLPADLVSDKAIQCTAQAGSMVTSRLA